MCELGGGDLEGGADGLECTEWNQGCCGHETRPTFGFPVSWIWVRVDGDVLL